MQFILKDEENKSILFDFQREMDASTFKGKKSFEFIVNRQLSVSTLQTSPCTLEIKNPKSLGILNRLP